MLATSDVPGGVVNVLTGSAAEVAPWLASHADVNAIDLAGAGGLDWVDLEIAAADTLKRVRRPEDGVSAPSLQRIVFFTETKTVWHTKSLIQESWRPHSGSCRVTRVTLYPVRGSWGTRGIALLLRVRRAFFAAVAMMVVVGGLVAAPTSAAAAEEGTIHALANQSRASSGLGPLALNGSLSQVALGWAQQLAASGVLSHNPSYSAQIPAGWQAAAENVAQGYPSASAVHGGWMNSAGHRANILGDFTDVGIAHIAGGGTTWSVQVFAKYAGSAGSAGPAAPPPAAAPAQPQPAPPVAPAPEAVPVAPPVPTEPDAPAPSQAEPEPTGSAASDSNDDTTADAEPTRTGAAEPDIADTLIAPAALVMVALLAALALAPAVARWWRRREPRTGRKEK